MASSGRKVKLPMPDGRMVEGIEVPIKESSEPWSEVHLEDGTIFRLKAVVASVVRIDGQFDQEGNPVYVVKATQAVSIVEVPESLRKKA
jgi:hypothetical protein